NPCIFHCPPYNPRGAYFVSPSACSCAAGFGAGTHINTHRPTEDKPRFFFFPTAAKITVGSRRLQRPHSGKTASHSETIAYNIVETVPRRRPCCRCDIQPTALPHYMFPIHLIHWTE